jgi:DNA-binding transcriptional regulator YiaG
VSDEALLDGIVDPSPGDILSARRHAGHSQSQAARIVGLGSGMRWSEYERGTRRPEAARWALYLLATGQHPGFDLAPRHSGKAEA